MTDTDRLAAALLLVHSWERETAESEARDILAADPTLVCPDPADHALADAALEYDEVNRDLESSGRHAEWWGKRNAFVRACDAYRAALEDKPEHECGFECSDTIAEEPPSPADDFCPDPADHALAAAVRRAIEHGATLKVYRSLGQFYHGAVWTRHGIPHEGAADDLTAAITAALEDPADHQVAESITVNGHHYVHVAACPCPEMVAATAALEDKP